MNDPQPSPSRDTRKTSAEKLTKLRELANEMSTVAARDPENPAAKKLGWYADRMNRVLDGEW